MTKEEKFNEFKQLLKNNTLEVVFTKVNGEKRTMKCTLKEELLEPLSGDIAIARPEQTSFSAIRVFDLDKAAWRSFRLDSILETKLL